MNNKIRITIILSAAAMVILSVLTITSLTKASEPLSASIPPEGYIPAPTAEKYGNSEALLLQDKDVWGSNSNELALQEAGISYDLLHSDKLSTLTGKELSRKYKFIMYSSDQTQEYYQNIEANIDKIEYFVENGGLLVAHVCDQAWTPANWSGMHILPGNVQHAAGIYLQDLIIADTAHQITRGTPTGKFDIYTTNPDYFDGWGWSTHGYLTNLPTGTMTIIKIGSGDYENQPAYIDYDFGKGKVLATMQTVEWGYFSGSQGWVGNRPELLRNELRLAKRIFPDEAKELAKEIIGADYLWGGKGYDFSKIRFATSGEIKSKYTYWDPIMATTTIGKGLDCSGLSFWSYNRAYYGDKKLVSYDVKNLWDYKKYENRPLYYQNANGQWIGNVQRIEQKDLMLGDLLFFDWDSNGIADHVEMYVGDYYYPGGTIRGLEYTTGTYNIVHPYGDQEHNYGIVPDKLSSRIKLEGFMGFGRPIDHIVAMKIVGGSPIDLIVTDPDGEVLTKEIQDTLSMEYMEYDIDGDSKPNDIIASPIRKIGDYSIHVIPEPDALPADTYFLEITANGQTIVLAENVPISEIPAEGYGIRLTETEIKIITPKLLKTDAVLELESAKTGNKKIDQKINLIIKRIQNSLDDKLWIDASRLVFFQKDCEDPGILKFEPDKINLEKFFEFDSDKMDLEMQRIFKGKCFAPKFGIKAFYEEYIAVKLMLNELKGEPRIPEELKNTFEEIIAKLVKADQLLAKTSLYDAKNTPVKNPKFKKIVEFQIKRAEMELSKAEKELIQNRPDKSILRLSKSWLHSQLAIKFANLEKKP